MRRKLKVTLDTPIVLSHVFEEPVVTISLLHEVLIAMLSIHFKATNQVGCIEKIENNHIFYTPSRNKEESITHAIRYDIVSIED